MHVPSPSRRPFLRTLGTLAAAAAPGSTARAQGFASIVRAAGVREALAFV